MNARRALTLLALFLFASCAGRKAPDHLVLVVFDTLRADRMSVYGHPRTTTPFLDSIAEDLVLFERFKAVAPWTLPTHATMLTGMLPADHRTQWGSMKLDDSAVTLAEHLVGQGFCTAGLSANPLVKPGNGLARGFDSWEHVGGPWSERTSSILERVPAMLQEAEEQGCRLFLFLNFMDTHIPYNSGAHGAEFGVSGPGPIKNAAIKWAVSAGKLSLAPEEWEQHRSAYDASVRSADSAARELVEQLKDLDATDRTLLVLTSDHGEGLGFHPEVGHSISVWEEQLAIPLAIRFPDPKLASGRIDTLRSQLELAPSLLDWLGVPRLPGTGDVPNLLDEAPRSVVADYRSYFTEGNRKTNVRVAENHPDLAERIHHQHVVYCGDLKLITRADGTKSAFDLISDRHEQEDLVFSESSARLRTCATEYRESVRSGLLTPFDADDLGAEDEPDLDTLRSLGYVQ